MPSRRLRYLVLIVCCGLLVRCTTDHWHVLVLSYEGTEEEESEILRTVSGVLTRTLSEQGFECTSDYGHDYFFSSCKIIDNENAVQGTSSFVFVEHLDEEGNIPVNIKSGTVAWHPFEPSDEYYTKWKRFVTAVVDSMSDVSYTSYTVD